MKTTILGVKIDQVNLEEATNMVMSWVTEHSKAQHYVVTPNLEFLIDAQTDPSFKTILNQADLAIPDSSRLGSISNLEHEKSLMKRFLTAASLPFSSQLAHPEFPVTTGIDLMLSICKEANQSGSTIGLLGSSSDIVQKTKSKLQKTFPQLKIVFASSGGQISKTGDWSNPEPIPSCDILFVALGHIKQENWIVKQMPQIQARVFIGVGGAFDYISGSVTRAPQRLRQLGLEWLFRLILQPWRLKRQLKIVGFLSKLVFS